ncbi:6-phospho-beta-glucosidase [Spiroplasma gladiatoris]|uniref:6-phospho-beta-glucosidase n=1 Tax=Spiroplasma gladiatoris TaxID=2143 RepID=A0A4P7AHR1_9MOLU|nr:glycoside hydrolase family 1 protein [Spiroplasma gladiatoris]QBQ07767.1 6-phospho-beta-glucosidase [Spiroplasma gladiatoris]
MISKFPKDFLWGASTSAYQFEGAYNVDGKGLSVQDFIGKHYPKDITDFKVTSDHYHRYKEDVEMMAKMGLKAYRFSIAWTRIIPDGNGEINQKGIEFYNNLIDELIKYNIEPIVTMYHFDLPDNLNKIGGWKAKETTEGFLKFAKAIFTSFKDKVKYWITINELNVMILSGHVINMVDDLEEWNRIKFDVLHNLNMAQAKVINLFRDIVPNGKIGPAPNISAVYPASSKPEDQNAKFNFSMLRNWTFLDVICRGSYNPFYLNFLKKQGYNFNPSQEDLAILRSAKPDFISFNYYSSSTVEHMGIDEKNTNLNDQQKGYEIPGYGKTVQNPNLLKTQFGWEIDPIGLKNTLKELYDRYNLPLLISENGIGARDVLTSDFKIHDDYRIEYYNQHISEMAKAIDDGVEMLGYCPWSAVDLVSTHEGISKRYGFIYVNRDEFDLKDLKRYPKDSFFWYKTLIENNGSDF